MAKKRTDTTLLWRAIEQAGGILAYVEAQLAERGAKVEIHTIRGVGYLLAEEKPK